MVVQKQTLLRMGGVVAALAIAAAPVLATAQSSGEADTQIIATVGNTLSINATGTVDLALTPGASGSVTSIGASTVTVTTNETSGYNLTLEDEDSNTSLISGANSIDSSNNGTYATPTTLQAGQWGYAVAGGAFDSSYTVGDNTGTGSELFAEVPASGAADIIKNRPGVAQADTTSVYFGVRVNGTQPSGAYADTVTFTASTNQ